MAVLQDININVFAQPSEKRLRTFLTLSQNENGRMINFRILGAPLPSNCTATFSGTKPDGNVYSTTGTVTGNFVVVAEDMQMTAVAGVWDAKLDIINGTHNIMTALIRVVVDADVVDPDAIASDSQLQGLVAEAKYYAEHARTEAYGSPLTASAKSGLTDKTRVYVYTGSESGMTAGHWYYWNGSAWADGGVYNSVAVQTDKTLAVADKAADAKITGDKISELKSGLRYNGIGNSFDGVLYNGYWNGSGVIVDYSNLDVCNLNKIPCKEDDNIVIVANTSVEDLTYFISYFNDTTRIQRDTGAGTIYKGKAPAGTKYVCFTFEKSGIDKSTFGKVYVYVDNSIDGIKKDLASIHADIGMVSTTFKMVPGSGHSSSLDKLYIPIPADTEYYVKASVSTEQVISGAIYEIYSDGTSQAARGSFYTETEYSYKASGDITAIGVYINPPSANCDVFVYVRTAGNLWTRLDNVVSNQNYKDEIIEQTAGIHANTFKMVSGYGHSSSLDQFNITIPKGSSYYVKAVASDGEVLPGQIYETYSDGTYHLASGSFYTGTEYKHTAEDNIYRIGLYIGAPSSNITVSAYVKHEIDALNDKHILENYRSTNNARHIGNDAGVPLTLLHFSDLHGDTGALKRITDYLSNYGTLVDDAICTGDMVPNTATAIESWWDSGVMTCVGNHDAASYDSSNGYDWDALSMADRVAYYISPFEANWDIVRESGKSYYYKDYTTQKVRLIVMDSQVYIANGADAAAQNTWLTNLLSDAITNNMHVVIAIHAPKGGSPVEQCSFSKYGRTNMVELGDSFTPQTVVDIVESSITSGLHFVGYIVGHNHQDYIYKATDKQLGFCITCAAVAQTAQWTGSDQHRSGIEDAFNLVTIDTVNTLIKIVRGGGADIDDHMRTRKAICFNYSTGEKVGEVL